MINSDGSGLITLTNSIDYYPSWSSDGLRIVFNSRRDGNWEIYTMNADGSNQTRITNNASIDIGPKWSPSGDKIAFSSNRDGNQEIYLSNLEIMQ